MNGTPNISGTNGKLLNVTEEELAKHNLKTDCWTAISGKHCVPIRAENQPVDLVFQGVSII